MIGTVIFNLIIAPLEMLFELVFSLAYRLFDQPLLVIISLSIVVNLIALPLYKRADAIQEEENERQAKMAHWINHIKKTFKGDERYMMITTYYRQQGYKSYYSLRSSFSLLLQIPFFIAAYHYLSNLELLKTMDFWIFHNLGAPDQLLAIGGLHINIMPIIMTLINVGSAYIYLKGSTVSQKIQTYVLAAAFLVLLYNSPSGLVIYWTCNQIFSLLKNVFMKLVKNNKILGLCISVAGVILFLAILISGHADTKKKLIFIVLILLCCQIPLVSAIVKSRRKNNMQKESRPVSFKVYLFTAIFLTIFLGMVIPLSVVSSSPAEFMVYGNTPGQIVLNTVTIMAGVFIVWCGVFYYLGTKGMRTVFAYILLAVAGVSVVDFFFFGKNLGTLSETLVFDTFPVFARSEKLINLLIIIAVIVCCILIMKIFKKYMFYVMVVLCVAAVGLCITQFNTVSDNLAATGVAEHKIASDEVEPIFNLSRTGKNVVVVMLDRGIGAMVPYILEEKPELKEQFAGFTYYPNTISFGGHTNIAIPALFGGYEYTPTEINKRSKEYLVDKHNEALRVMPAIFSENGFEVTMTDTAYANYSSTPDFSIFADIPNINTRYTIGQYECENADEIYKAQKKVQDRNFFFYSFFKAVPEFLQNTVYDNGNYFSTDNSYYTSEVFMDNYSVLAALPKMTNIEENGADTFLCLDNEAPHSPTTLKVPEYEAGIVSKDSIFEHKDDYVIDGRKMKMDTWYKVSHYEVNMASFLKLADWFDFLRSEGVWDNTKIILVADHGNGMGEGGQFDDMLINEVVDAERFNPLLMVKDFNAKEYTVSDEFMTNADVPTLAFADAVDHPVNPATGKEINSDEKNAHDQIITTSHHYHPKADHPTRKVFDTTDGQWWAVHDNIFEKDNWSFVAEGD